MRRYRSIYTVIVAAIVLSIAAPSAIIAAARRLDLRIDMLSVDGKCGVLTEVRSGFRYLNHRFLLVAIDNFEAGTFRILDTLPEQLYPGFTNEPGAVTFVQSDDEASTLIQCYCEEPSRRDTVLTTVGRQEANGWLSEVRYFSLNLRASLIAVDGIEYSTLLKRISPDGTCAHVFEARFHVYPRFSQDGTKLLFRSNTWPVEAEDADTVLRREDEIGEIWQYDVDTGIFGRLFVSAGAKEWPQMGPGDSNIYYIRNSWPGGYTNIWMYSSDQGETQVTDFAWPMEVRDFFLVADTLLVVLCDFSGPSFFKETRVTIPLK